MTGMNDDGQGGGRGLDTARLLPIVEHAFAVPEEDSAWLSSPGPFSYASCDA